MLSKSTGRSDRSAPHALTLSEDQRTLDALLWILEFVDYDGRDSEGTPVFIVMDHPDEEPIACMRPDLARLLARLWGSAPTPVVEFLLTSLTTVAVIVERAVDDVIKRALSGPLDGLADGLDIAVATARLGAVADLRIAVRDARDEATHLERTARR